jgi:ribosomal protein S18 acetylase RimI-like enzyme
MVTIAMTEIRAAASTDYPAIAGLFGELGVDDPTPTAERWTRDLMPGTLVYDRAGDVLGYVNFYKLAVAGHVRNLVVAPGARRGGVGRALMTAAEDRLRGAGASEWHLNVKADNLAAIGLYESLGMTIEHESIALRLAWADLTAMPRAAAVASLVDPSDDDDLERAFGLLAGRIAMSRGRAGRVIVQLRDEACAPVGLACFDPGFPGAYPFCVARPALAAVLLDALRDHARPGDTHIQVVIENDPRLADVLIAAGAGVRLRLLHYRGAL